MATSDRPSARFRSATEFPKTIDHLSHSDASSFYCEMRECLIFTNRSRSQLMRRNEEHKQSALKLKTDVERLQALVDQLNLKEQTSAKNQQQVIAEFEAEIRLMAAHLDTLSAAFDQVEDIDNPNKAQWGFLAFPGRFLSFVRAVKAIVLWWRDERDDGSNTLPPATARALPDNGTKEEDRQQNPQMYTDPSSIGRSLLDK